MSGLFADLSVVAAATGFVGVAAFAFASDAPTVSDIDAPSDMVGDDHDRGDDGDDGDDGAVADPSVTADQVVTAAADAMGDVTSVAFSVERSGAAVFIDEFGSLALDALTGQFTVPGRARARLTVTVDGDLTTEIGAVAADGTVWLSNPVTGDFDLLPPGIDIDPARFFDPEGGWRPLLSGLRDVELVGIDDRGGDRYRIRGTAPAAEVSNITVGLVRDDDVPIELWIHPTSYLVTAAEFSTGVGSSTSDWRLELGSYGTTFSISPPTNITGGA